MNADRSKTRPSYSLTLWLVVPSLVLIIALGFDLWPVLRGNAEWRWPLRALESSARVLVPIVALGFYIWASIRWLKGFEREAISPRFERLGLLFITLAAPLIQLSLAAGVSRLPLLEFFGPTVSVHNSGYFTTAVNTPDLNSLLANFPAQMPQLPIHAQSHPPGLVIAQWLSWRTFQTLPVLADAIAPPLRTLQCHNPGLMVLDNAQIASASLGMLLPLLGGLAVWPLYAFAKRISKARVAALTVLLFPLLPMFAVWMSQWDQIYPLLLFLGLYLAHTGLEKNSWRRIFAAGVPLSVASFLSVGNFVLMMIVALYAVAWLWSQRTSLPLSVSQPLRLAITFAFGCASIWLLYWLFYGVDPFRMISAGSRLAFESTTGSRSYGMWLLGNPIDFLVFLGFPISILFVYNLLKRIPFPKSLLPIACATFGTLILLWLSGIVRGEVGRLWMYFGPLMVLIAVGWLEAGGDSPGLTYYSSRMTFYASLIALVGMQLLVMNTRWLVNDSFLDVPPERSVVLNPPTVSISTSAKFADQIALRGYAAQSLAHVIQINLVWQALAQPPHAYTVFAHVVDANGRQVGQQDHMPVHDQLPTSCWTTGEFVSDPYTMPLAEGAQPPFSVEVGLYRGDTGARLPRSDTQGSSVTLAVP